MILKVKAVKWRGATGSAALSRLLKAVLLAMEQWFSVHCAFVVLTYFKRGDFVVVTQRQFC